MKHKLSFKLLAPFLLCGFLLAQNPCPLAASPIAQDTDEVEVPEAVEDETEEQADDDQADDEEPDDDVQKIAFEVIAEGLTNPCGIAIQPDTGTVFVSDSGAMRVIRIVDEKTEEVVTGFSKEPLSEIPAYEVGPLGLAFLDATTLIVGEGGKPAGEETLRTYTVPEPGEPPLNFDGTSTAEEEEGGEATDDEASDDETTDENDSESSDDENADDENADDESADDDSADAEVAQEVDETEVDETEADETEVDETVADEAAEPVEAGLSLAATDDAVAEGDFFGIYASENAVYVTCHGDREKGWLARAEVVENKLSNFVRKIATTENTGTAAPMAVAKSPDGFLVVAQMGTTDTPGDSMLSFYDESGEELGNDKYETGLNDIVGIAYGPTRGRLFAIDMSISDPEMAGLYKLVGDADSDTGCRADLVMKLERPTAMAFDPEGDLYITVAGTDETSGKLVRIKGLDVEPESDEE